MNGIFHGREDIPNTNIHVESETKSLPISPLSGIARGLLWSHWSLQWNFCHPLGQCGGQD